MAPSRYAGSIRTQEIRLMTALPRRESGRIPASLPFGERGAPSVGVLHALGTRELPVPAPADYDRVRLRSGVDEGAPLIEFVLQRAS